MGYDAPYTHTYTPILYINEKFIYQLVEYRSGIDILGLFEPGTHILAS